MISRVGFRNGQSRYPRTRKYFEKKKIYRKKKFFFANVSIVRKNFEKKNSTSKLIFLLRSKKIHFEVKKSTSKLKIF